jgi:hypothetical protein
MTKSHYKGAQKHHVVIVDCRTPLIILETCLSRRIRSLGSCDCQITLFEVEEGEGVMVLPLPKYSRHQHTESPDKSRSLKSSPRDGNALGQ